MQQQIVGTSPRQQTGPHIDVNIGVSANKPDASVALIPNTLDSAEMLLPYTDKKKIERSNFWKSQQK